MSLSAEKEKASEPSAAPSGSAFVEQAAQAAINTLQRDADRLRDTMEKMQYNHQADRERIARVIRRLVRYADRVAERHPRAVTGNGQAARTEGGIWLAEFDRQNAEASHGEKEKSND